MNYKKVRTVFINDKKKVIYAKPKGTREYVKSKGEMVLLTAYLKKVEKLAAKKALLSKVAKKSKAVKKSTKSKMSKGGFFFAAGETLTEDEIKEENKRLNTPSSSSMSSKLEVKPQMKHSVESHGIEPGQTGGYYYNDYRKLGGNYPQKFLEDINNAAQMTVSDLYKKEGAQNPLTGGKKRKGKKAKKVNPNPLKKLLNSLSLRRQKRGKKRGGDDSDVYEYE